MPWQRGKRSSLSIGGRSSSWRSCLTFGIYLKAFWRINEAAKKRAFPPFKVPINYPPFADNIYREFRRSLPAPPENKEVRV